MEPDAQLEWERRNARSAGLAATAAAGCLLIGLLYTTLVGAEAQFRVYERALQANDEPHLVIVPSVLQTVGYALFAWALYYLARATLARRPQMLRPAPVLAVIGPALKSVTVVLTAIALLGIASDTAALDVAATTDRAPGLFANAIVAEQAAIDVRDENSVLEVRQILVLAANLALGFALVLVGLNAMRAGLLSRFMGILGIISGVLTVLFQGAGIIEAFWLAAIGAIFLDRWPGGRGPAWESGEAEPWPSAMDQRQEETETQTETGARDEAGLDLGEEEPDGQPHPASKKRKKRKRR